MSAKRLLICFSEDTYTNGHRSRYELIVRRDEVVDGRVLVLMQDSCVETIYL